MKKLSIITINLNNSEGLLKTIESVVHQTFKDFEYIILDGGSEDNSLDILNQFEGKINYWSSEKDKGIYNALNKGIKLSKGEYLLFLHSGDCLINNTILQEIFQEEQIEDILYGNIEYFLPKLNQNVKSELPDTFDLYFFFKYSLWHQASFIKKSLFDQIGYYNEQNDYVSDWEFFFEAIIFRDASCKNLRTVITKYDMYNGITMKKNKESENERISILRNKIHPSVYSLLLKHEQLETRLNEILRSDSHKIYRWLDKRNNVKNVIIIISKPYTWLCNFINLIKRVK